MQGPPDLPSTNLKRQLTFYYTGLVGANLIAWIWAFIAFADSPALLAASLLAYGLGLRHAVDADHIAAIDNVTRKLMNEGQRPLAVGLFFSLGHSTIVVVLTLIVGLTTVLVTTKVEGLAFWGSLIGTGTSAFFLLFIGLANLLVFSSVWRAYRAARAGTPQNAAEIEKMLTSRGFWGRLFRRFFGLVSRSWHMYPLGLLFGLGFDTATEIGLLSLSAVHAGQGVSLWSILVFPALFAAGMSLLDTTDGILMIKAYGWAFAEPVRKLRYNLAITFFSVVIALGVGLLQLANLIGLGWGQGSQGAPLLVWMADHSARIGLIIAGLFIFTFLLSKALYRIRRRAKMEAILTQTGARP